MGVRFLTIDRAISAKGRIAADEDSADSELPVPRKDSLGTQHLLMFFFQLTHNNNNAIKFSFLFFPLFPIGRNRKDTFTIPSTPAVRFDLEAKFWAAGQLPKMGTFISCVFLLELAV